MTATGPANRVYPMTRHTIFRRPLHSKCLSLELGLLPYYFECNINYTMLSIGRSFINILTVFRSSANRQFIISPMFNDTDRRTAVSLQSRGASVFVFVVLVLCLSFGDLAFEESKLLP